MSLHRHLTLDSGDTKLKSIQVQDCEMDRDWVYPGRSYFSWETVQGKAANAGLSVTLRPDYTKLIQEASWESG